MNTRPWSIRRCGHCLSPPQQSAGLQAPSFIKLLSSLGRICWNEEFHIVTTCHFVCEISKLENSAGMFRAPVLSGGALREKNPGRGVSGWGSSTPLSPRLVLWPGGLSVGGGRRMAPPTPTGVPGPQPTRRRGFPNPLPRSVAPQSLPRWGVVPQSPPEEAWLPIRPRGHRSPPLTGLSRP